jgi:hypothetical protein
LRPALHTVEPRTTPSSTVRYVGLKLGVKPVVGPHKIELDMLPAERRTDPEGQLRQFELRSPPALIEFLRECVPTEGAAAGLTTFDAVLRGVMSPRTMVTIPMDKRKVAGVPADAMVRCVCSCALYHPLLHMALKLYSRALP